MRTLLSLAAIVMGCHAQVTVKYSIQPSGVFRSLVGRDLPARTALYEAVACSSADSVMDEVRLLHAAPFSTVSQATAITLQETRSRSAWAWKLARIGLPIAAGILVGADIGPEALQSAFGAGGIGVQITGAITDEARRREALPAVGPFVGGDVLMLGAGRCVTRLLLGEYPAPVKMPVTIQIGQPAPPAPEVKPSSDTGLTHWKTGSLQIAHTCAGECGAALETPRNWWLEVL